MGSISCSLIVITHRHPFTSQPARRPPFGECPFRSDGPATDWHGGDDVVKMGGIKRIPLLRGTSLMFYFQFSSKIINTTLFVCSFIANQVGASDAYGCCRAVQE